MTKQLERRFLNLEQMETRMEGGTAEDATEPTELVGYGAVFYQENNPATEFELIPGRVWERIMPGSFDEAIAEMDIRCLYNHNPSLLLGRSRAGTLQLTTDAKGLLYRCTLPETSTGKDVRISVQRGDLYGSSIGMVVTARTLIEDEERLIRQIDKVEIYDVGPVTYPAYGTHVSLRSASPSEISTDELKLLLAPRRRARVRQLRRRNLDC